MRLLHERRWLRFSLSSLLIAATLFCVWLGWQASIVRERRAVKELLEGKAFALAAYDPPYANFVRRMMDDVPMLYNLACYNLTSDEIERVKKAFPELVDFQVVQTPEGR
jgi:hypothetical protein